MELNELIESLGSLSLKGAESLCIKLYEQKDTLSIEEISLLVRDGLWGISLSPSLGVSFCRGYLKLLGSVPFTASLKYSILVREAEKKGITLCQMMAQSLPLILLNPNPDVLVFFQKAIEAMLTKGSYTLSSPLKCLSQLLENEHTETAVLFLNLLKSAFCQNLSYNAAQILSLEIPKGVLDLNITGQSYHLSQWNRVVKADYHLSGAFLSGIKKGLLKLSEPDLIFFITTALEKYKKKRRLGETFLSLDSHLGLECLDGLSKTVSLNEIQPRLNQYLSLRTDFPIHVQPISHLKKIFQNKRDSGPFVCSDGRWIYLPDTISCFDSKMENRSLYLFLTKMEVGFYEFGSYDFSYEKFLSQNKICEQNLQSPSLSTPLEEDGISDITRFLQIFDRPMLARDLLLIIESGRIRWQLKLRYQGLFNKLGTYAGKMFQSLNLENEHHPLFPLYTTLFLGVPLKKEDFNSIIFYEYCKTIESQLLSEQGGFSKKDVHESAIIVFSIYRDIVTHLHHGHKNFLDRYTALSSLFNIRLRPSLYETGIGSAIDKAMLIKEKLKKKGISIDRIDLQKSVLKKGEALSNEDVCQIAESFSFVMCTESMEGVITSAMDEILFKREKNDSLSRNLTSLNTYRYKEWDYIVGDYLPEYTAVSERIVSSKPDPFYTETVKRRQALIKKIHYIFELIKPEGLFRLRRWVDGDEFDYRALIDYIVDKRSGYHPEDRFYIKKVKSVRDVATLLLIDLSRSTENKLGDSALRVIDVEKEAAVLFSEALHVVGDQFAIYGYSGSSRQSVQFYQIKDFEEPYSSLIKNRIGNIHSSANTRMGSAIRHATKILENIKARTRMMMLLGDGFPNDLDYKSRYAIEDTHKAILEARFENIVTQAITVNMGADPKLDDLYGPFHHTVISDVTELPDRLLTLYTRITGK